MSNRYKTRVEELLCDAGITTPPVSVERVASMLGAEVCFEPFEGAVSGMMYREGDHVVIGVNALDAKTRQRFTVAHEIGHMVLHDQPLYVDRRFRDGLSAQGVDPSEIQANNFAAELLMPTEMLLTDLQNRLLDYDDDELIQELADRYKVSVQAMTFRLGKLAGIGNGE